MISELANLSEPKRLYSRRPSKYENVIRIDNWGASVKDNFDEAQPAYLEESSTQRPKKSSRKYDDDNWETEREQRRQRAYRRQQAREILSPPTKPINEKLLSTALVIIAILFFMLASKDSIRHPITSQNVFARLDNNNNINLSETPIFAPDQIAETTTAVPPATSVIQQSAPLCQRFSSYATAIGRTYLPISSGVEAHGSTYMPIGAGAGTNGSSIQAANTIAQNIEQSAPVFAASNATNSIPAPTSDAATIGPPVSGPLGRFRVLSQLFDSTYGSVAGDSEGQE